MTIYEKLRNIQSKLEAPKGQHNNFGNYDYRSCEDILGALKPLLNNNDCVLTLSDEIINIGERFYIKATARLFDSDGEVSNSAFAREALTKKGMDDSQVTGTASSYARKYALNGLFCIDDTKDADTDEYKNQQRNNQPSQKNNQKKQNTARQNKQSNTVKLITAEQGQAIQEHLDKTNMSIGELLTAYKITSLSQLPESKYPALIKRLKELASG